MPCCGATLNEDSIPPWTPEAVKKLNRDDPDVSRLTIRSLKRAQSARSTQVARAFLRTLGARGTDVD
jgi:hypothetical protein